MSPCEKCNIEEKIHVCCGRYPQNGRRTTLAVGEGREIMACPYLDVGGRCRIYDKRPMDCRNFFCSRFDRESENTFRRFEWIADLLKDRDG